MRELRSALNTNCNWSISASFSKAIEANDPEALRIASTRVPEVGLPALIPIYDEFI
jgi:hypothetical protein